MIGLQGPVVVRILSYMSPWDRTQNASLVCRKWAQIARTFPKLDPVRRQIAWLTRKHLLEGSGPLRDLFVKSFPGHLKGFSQCMEKYVLTSVSVPQGLCDLTEVTLQNMLPFTDLDLLKMMVLHGNLCYVSRKEEELLQLQHCPPHTQGPPSKDTCYIVSDRDTYFLLGGLRTMFTVIEPHIWHTFSREEYYPIQEYLNYLESALERNFGIICTRRSDA